MKLKIRIFLILYFGGLFNLSATLHVLNSNTIRSANGSTITTTKKAHSPPAAKPLRSQTIKELEDTLKARLTRLEDKKGEYVRLLREIDKDRQTLYEQQKKISRQKKLLYRQDTRITKQRNVIIIIGALSLLALFLLIYVVRANKQRKIANLLLTRKKIEIEKQKILVDEKQKEILDSIKYAKRIQKALIANDKMMNDNLKDYFILFKPKDIVSGDFYWIEKKGNLVYEKYKGLKTIGTDSMSIDINKINL